MGFVGFFADDETNANSEDAKKDIGIFPSKKEEISNYDVDNIYAASFNRSVFLTLTWWKRYTYVGYTYKANE